MGRHLIKKSSSLGWNMKTLFALIAATFVGCTSPSLAQSPPTSASSSLTEMYSNPDFQLTGVTVSTKGRMFVNFPKWSDHYVNAVVEILHDGTAKPFPNEDWNRWSGKAAEAGNHFVCVQSVVADDDDTLWVVDAAAPMMGPIVHGGPKLVAIDLNTNQVKKIYAIDSDAIKPNSYLNDVRIDTARHTAYMTDSGVGGLIVVDTATAKVRRVLDGQPSVQAQPDTKITIGGRPLLGESGKTPQINSDGIALSPDGEYLYYQALTSRNLYRVKAEALRNHSKNEDWTLQVEQVAETFPVDGLWMDKAGNLYLSDLQRNAIVRRSPDGKMQTIITDPRLKWPDTFTEGPDGLIYITASHLNEAPRFNRGKDARTQPYAVFRFHP